MSVLLLEKGTIMLNKLDFTMLRFIGHERNRNKPTDAFAVYSKPGKKGPLGRREMFSEERGLILVGGDSQGVPVPSSSSCPHQNHILESLVWETCQGIFIWPTSHSGSAALFLSVTGKAPKWCPADKLLCICDLTWHILKGKQQVCLFTGVSKQGNILSPPWEIFAFKQIWVLKWLF